MDYKIVASDLDGTLLNNKSDISYKNLKAIKQLSDKGVFFVLSTGRSLSEIPEQLRQNTDIRYIIYSNGAVVLDKNTGHKISNCISKALGAKILDILYSYNTHITFRCDGKCFVDSEFQSDDFFTYYNVCTEHQQVVNNFALYLDDFKKSAYSSDNVETFSAFFHNYDEKVACKNQLEKLSNLRIVEPDKYNLEIFNINAGKGNALCSLAKMLKVDTDKTISIGDSNNDSTIIQSAGLGLAVANACDSLKQVADDIICSNDEHVAHYVLSHYFSEF